jgi:tetratricopeptide (TPR) repeat protein
MGGPGVVAWGRGGARLSEARQFIEEALTIYREIGHRFYMQVMLTLLGCVSNSMRRYEEAQKYFQEALELSKQIGRVYNAIRTLAGLGEAALGLGDFQTARRYLLEALETPGSTPVILEAMVSWAMLLKKEAGQPEQKKQAVEILSLVTNHPITWQIYRDKAAFLLAELEAELSPEVVASAKARAKSRTLDEAVAEILQGDSA